MNSSGYHHYAPGLSPDSPQYAIASMLGRTLTLDPTLCTEKPPEWWLDEQSRKILQWPHQPARGSRRRLCLIPLCVKRQRFPSLACRGHKDLDPVRMKRLADCLKREAKYFLKRCSAVMLAYPVRVGGDTKSKSYEPEIMAEIRKVGPLMNDVLLLFKEPEFDVERTPPPRGESQMQTVESGCAACILAVVGGRDEVLISLRACMLAREKVGMEPSPLLPLVDAWIRGHGEYAVGFFAHSDGMAGRFAEQWRLWSSQLEDRWRPSTPPHVYESEGVEWDREWQGWKWQG
ncbi:hypothetical protein QBC34DRAFT_426368 [Podospora aff. communis PSN243]|uniref:Uncharacterized protein n=1 Tax=Podospora aff. communis PSN243 TaxID=3040156 RepID=A0AAV9GLL8_9PEZI|nr:hypothetical protein QBC34DRAFT_426368 [Podospora aff. communis PSN243]